MAREAPEGASLRDERSCLALEPEETKRRSEIARVELAGGVVLVLTLIVLTLLVIALTLLVVGRLFRVGVVVRALLRIGGFVVRALVVRRFVVRDVLVFRGRLVVRSGRVGPAAFGAGFGAVGHGRLGRIAGFLLVVSTDGVGEILSVRAPGDAFAECVRMIRVRPEHRREVALER